MSQVEDTKVRLIVAWMSWLLMLSGGGFVLLLMLFIAIVFYIGGMDAIISIANRSEDRTKNYSSILYPLIFVAYPIGAKFGIWLWAKLARKTKLISEEKIKKMT